MAEAQTKEDVQKVVPLTYNDLIWMQQQETNKRMDRLEKSIDTTRQELNARMDKLEERLETTRQELNARMDKQDEKIDSLRRELNARMDKQDDKIDRLADKIDAMHNEIKSSTSHISIANISTVAIAVGVLYSLFSK